MNTLRITTVCTALGLAALASPAHAVDVFIDFTGDQIGDAVHVVAPGEIFTGSVYASLDDTNDGLASFGVSLTFDEPPITISDAPSKLNNVTIDPQWSFVPTKSVGAGALDAGGSLDLFATEGPHGPAVHLFDVVFEALNPGLTPLAWGLQDPTPGFDNFVAFDFTSLDGDVSFMASEVQVVPVPAALPLLASALMGFGWLARRRGTTYHV